MLEGKINTWQATALFTSIITSTAVFFPPSFIAQQAGRDAWLAFLLGSAYGLLALALTVPLHTRYPGRNFFQIGEVLLGQLLGKLFALAYVFFLIVFTCIVVREFAGFLATTFMPRTPVEFFSAVIVAMGLYAVYHGVEVIARVSELTFFIVVFVFLFFFAMGIKELDLSVVLPILNSGLAPVLKGSAIYFVWSGQIFFLSLLFPYLNRPAQAWKVGVLSLAATAFLLAIGAIFLESFFGYQFTARAFFPALSYARVVGIAGFLERIEVLVIPIWVTGIYLKIAFLIFVSAKALKDQFGVTEERNFLLPLGLLIIFLSVLLFENILEHQAFLKSSWVFCSVFFYLFLPLLLNLLHILRNVLGAGSAST